MTVGQLMEELRKYEPEREVFLSMASEDGLDVLDAAAQNVSLMAGHVFISAEDE